MSTSSCSCILSCPWSGNVNLKLTLHTELSIVLKCLLQLSCPWSWNVSFKLYLHTVAVHGANLLFNALNIYDRELFTLGCSCIVKLLIVLANLPSFNESSWLSWKHDQWSYNTYANRKYTLKKWLGDLQSNQNMFWVCTSINIDMNTNKNT